MYFKKLNKKQEQKFIEYYSQDYSASLIFEMFNQKYPKNKTSLANSRMIAYRKKLGLPKRGLGYKPLHRRPAKSIEEKEQLRLKRLQKRLTKIPVMIQRARLKIGHWQEEVRQIEKQLNI